MKILAVDQARHGAWAVYDYEGKKLLDYGTWGFDSKNYTFEQEYVWKNEYFVQFGSTHTMAKLLQSKR